MSLRLVKVLRKSAVLRRSQIPCLSDAFVVNMLSGCPFRCKYCYAQSFSTHPGWGKVLFYHNSFEKLKAEFASKRKKPKIVIFSTSCEPFSPIKEVLEQLYKIMEFLLERSVSLSITTKGIIPQEFLELFSRHRSLLSIDVSLTHTDDRKRRLVEPNAPPVRSRFDQLRRLSDMGIDLVVRVDPLIPGFTDSNDDLDRLFRRIKAAGVKDVVCSYLFLREANIRELANLGYAGFSFGDMIARLYTQRASSFCGKENIYIPSAEYRSERYKLIASLAELYGLNLHLCSCKEPDVTVQSCSSESGRASRIDGYAIKNRTLKVEGGAKQLELRFSA